MGQHKLPVISLVASHRPSELRISKHVIPSLAHVGKEIFELLADEPLGNLLDGDANLGERELKISNKKAKSNVPKSHNVVSSTDRKGHALTGQVRVGSLEDDIGGRVVAFGVPVD